MARLAHYYPVSAENQAAQEPQERRLWRSVISRALIDLALPVEADKWGNDRNRNDRESAKMFLLSNARGYREWRDQVFYHAGIDGCAHHLAMRGEA